MNVADAVLLVIALTLAAGVGASRLRVPMPVVLAITGVGAGLLWRRIPGLPPISVPPERVLLVFLPPLLTTGAYALPLGAFRHNLRAIALLAVGLVLATMAATAVVAHAVAGLPWAAAFVLGTIVAPPDPVAATAVARQTGLAHRLVTILEGEGLVNDAVAIVVYHLAVAAALTGTFTWVHAGLVLLREVPIGIVVGLAVGAGAVALRRHVDDVALEAGFSLFVPYLTYEAAERLGGSSVLAVVTFGFVLQRHALSIGTPAPRLAARTVWNAVQFVSTALVFFLLGLLLGEMTSTLLTPRHLVPAAAVAGTAVGLRLAWMYVVPELTRVLRRGAVDSETPTWRERTVLGWSGMRGVVSLALALALPAFPGGSAGAAARTTVIVLAFGVIVATLGLQGLTLLPVAARVRAGDPERDPRDEARLRAQARRAGLAAIDRWARTTGLSDAACARLTDDVRTGRIGIAAVGDEAEPDVPLDAIIAVLRAQRTLVDDSHDAGRIGGALAERLQTELDVDAMRLRGDAARLTTGGGNA